MKLRKLKRLFGRREPMPVTVNLDFPTTQEALDVIAEAMANQGVRAQAVEAQDPMGNTIRAEVQKRHDAPV